MHNFKVVKNSAACLRASAISREGRDARERSNFHGLQGCGSKVSSSLRDELNGNHVLSSDPRRLSDKGHSNI